MLLILGAYRDPSGDTAGRAEISQKSHTHTPPRTCLPGRGNGKRVKQHKYVCDALEVDSCHVENQSRGGGTGTVRKRGRGTSMLNSIIRKPP